MNATQRLVYDALVAAVEAGEPCPSNQALGDRVGLSAELVSATVSQLAKLELILVARFQAGRDVTIVASGKATAPHAGSRVPHWRDRGGRSARKPAPRTATRNRGTVASAVTIPENVRRVDRDPCPRCNVRGDIGCRHGDAERGFA